MKILHLFLLTLMSLQAWAQEGEDIQYVTGKLYLSLYEQADSGSKVIKSLVSGDRLDVIEIAGPYAKVITLQEKEGWVKKGFLVKSKPASILYREVNVAYKGLQQKMADFNEKNSSLFEIEAKLEALAIENEQLKSTNELFKKQQEHKINQKKEISEASDKVDLEHFEQFVIEYKLFFIALLILLVLIGFRAGEIKTESDVMKHFGGVKVW